jgi:hypothetical protein
VSINVDFTSVAEVVAYYSTVVDYNRYAVAEALQNNPEAMATWAVWVAANSLAPNSESALSGHLSQSAEGESR